MNRVQNLLQDLVRLPSVNPMGRSLDESLIYEHRVTAYLEKFFSELGVRCERQTVAPQRDNIVAYYDALGAQCTIMLEAHQDTVPVDAMTIDPFAAVVEGGRLHGRGACDVKGPMAAMLAAFARIVKEKPPGACNVVMACTVDEEHTSLGAQRLVQDERLIGRIDFAVVAEPTQLKIVRAHKGTVRWSIHVRGKACHSSQPESGVNAIYHAARILSLIEEYAHQLRRSRVDSLLGAASLSVGRIEGGTSVNVVPDHCTIEIDRRLLPGEEPNVALGQLRDFLEEQAPEEIELDLTEPWARGPALSPVGSEEIVQRARDAIDAATGSHEVVAVPYGTDAGWLSQAGIPSIVLGPGDVAQAHTCDEWIDLAQLARAEEVYYRLATAQ